MIPGQRQSTQELRQSDILVATICVTAVNALLIYSAYELIFEAGVYRLQIYIWLGIGEASS
jgi:hypothetical protein